MLECKDCCLYNTDACRYGRYALEHNMSLNCDDFIVEHNNAYQQGRAEAIEEYDRWLSTYNVTTDYCNHRIMVDRGGIKRYASDLYLEQIKEQKEKRNG